MRAASVTAELERLATNGRNAAPISLAKAQAYCRGLARTHYENFAVATRLLPPHLRQHFCNVYAYCRWSDDLADETAGGQASVELLDQWEKELLACYGGTPRHPILVALTDTIREFDIPAQPFRQLLVAFRQDQSVSHYETLNDLLEYCQSSANPVGHLVLYLGRCYDQTNAALSDHICTALQLANFGQDVRRDWERGRLYLPREICRRAGCREEQLAVGGFDAHWRDAVKTLVDDAAARFDQGAALIARLPRELQLDVWLFLEGGRAILRKIRALNFDVWQRRPIVSKRDQLSLFARGLWLKLMGRLATSQAVSQEVRA